MNKYSLMPSNLPPLFPAPGGEGHAGQEGRDFADDRVLREPPDRQEDDRGAARPGHHPDPRDGDPDRIPECPRHRAIPGRSRGEHPLVTGELW